MYLICCVMNKCGKNLIKIDNIMLRELIEEKEGNYDLLKDNNYFLQSNNKFRNKLFYWKKG